MVNKIDLAYLAGFLDGDGSIMLQLHRSSLDSKDARIKLLFLAEKCLRKCPRND
jgi:hypothetical protein